jgi:NAD(P)-dependent dehydrogenase (short-subunit alcohol dehydrogenase family)
MRCDHRDDAQVAAVFARVLAEQSRIDVLVNNAFGSPPQSVLWGGGPFWTLPTPPWDDVIDVGLRAFHRRPTGLLGICAPSSSGETFTLDL